MTTQDTKPKRCAECGEPRTGLPYLAAVIVKVGEFFLSVVTCSKECQHAYNARRAGAAIQTDEVTR